MGRGRANSRMAKTGCNWPMRANVTSNNALERPIQYRGRAVLAMNFVLGGTEHAPCLAAQLDR
jgi:hypothetical protein